MNIDQIIAALFQRIPRRVEHAIRLLPQEQVDAAHPSVKVHLDRIRTAGAALEAERVESRRVAEERAAARRAAKAARP